MNPPGFIDRKNNSREPRPGEIKSALSVKLTDADMREMPGIIQRAKERGWMSDPDESGNARPLHRGEADAGPCGHCGGKKEIRNPTGRCDHLYWPDNLTDEARRANGL